MAKTDYLIIIKGLLLAKNTEQTPAEQTQKLIDHFDKLWQESK
jgi:hypothetical protein